MAERLIKGFMAATQALASKGLLKVKQAAKRAKVKHGRAR
jgi:hypothetical protein